MRKKPYRQHAEHAGRASNGQILLRLSYLIGKYLDINGEEPQRGKIRKIPHSLRKEEEGKYQECQTLIEYDRLRVGPTENTKGVFFCKILCDWRNGALILDLVLQCKAVFYSFPL